jgi:putative ABC transport system ATP-binding protein
MEKKSGREVLHHLEGVTKTYYLGEVPVEALRDISLDVFEGEILVILGPSGSGKSTLLNILGGMDKPSSGIVLFRNRDISLAEEKERTLYRRNEIGFVFQFFNLIPDLTAAENVTLAADLVKDPLATTDVLNEVGLASRYDHFPSQMSAGEQQRISIARALVKKPRIILCDEPTGALDDATAQSVLVYLERVARTRGSTVVIVTHNTAIAPMADRVVRMRSGTVAEIITNPTPLPAEKIEW